MKSIWKSSKKFEIEMVGQNLFLILFANEVDTERVMEGRPWFFKKQLVLMERLLDPIQRNQVQLVMSPIWLKIGPCSPECDKKDLMHEVGSTFGGLKRSKTVGNCCRLLIVVEVRNPL